MIDKNKIIEKHRLSEKDTGSVEVQVSLLTARIESLTEHSKANKKDHHSRKGLINLVSRRKRLLNYLQKEDIERYRKLIKELKIRG